MLNILFVCHGNICRSPMAEFVFKEFVKRMELTDSFERILSAATSQEEIGNGVYPPVAKLLDKLNIDYSKKRARQITKTDCLEYDCIILMDDNNVRNLNYLHSDIDKSKVFKLMDFTDIKGDVDDPWYTRDFERTFDEVKLGCIGLLKYLKQNNQISFEDSVLNAVSLSITL